MFTTYLRYFLTLSIMRWGHFTGTAAADTECCGVLGPNPSPGLQCCVRVYTLVLCTMRSSNSVHRLCTQLVHHNPHFQNITTCFSVKPIRNSNWRGKLWRHEFYDTFVLQAIQGGVFVFYNLLGVGSEIMTPSHLVSSLIVLLSVSNSSLLSLVATMFMILTHAGSGIIVKIMNLTRHHNSGVFDLIKMKISTFLLPTTVPGSGTEPSQSANKTGNSKYSGVN